jgi:autotransporter-associated beta strand protein
MLAQLSFNHIILAGRCFSPRMHLPACRKIRMRILTPLLLGLLLLPRLTRAASVTLLSTDASGTTSFTGSTNWSNNAVPVSANNYYTSTFGLRTPPDANNYTFAGHSLTLQPGTTSGYSVIYKGTAAANTYTINNLTNNGGLIRSGAGSGNTCIIAGTMVVSGNSTIQADQSPFIINANLSGGATLTNLNPAPQTYGTVTYGGTNSAFTGGFLLGPNAIFIFANTNSVPGNPASPNPAQITFQAGATFEDLVGVTLKNANGGITLAGNATINVSATNLVTRVTEPVTGGNVSLAKTGPGALYLDATNPFTGTTTVSAGTLAGIGSLSGPVVVTSTGNLGAGETGTTVGTLTISNNLTLQGNTTLRVNNTGGLPVNDQVTVTGSLTYGGILTVPNLTTDGIPLSTTNTFQLFNVAGSVSGNFTGIVGSPGAGLVYNFNPTNGVLSVAGALLHRYSFFSEPNGSLTATDSIAGANGTLAGSAAISGGKLVLNGASGTYANLPGGLITGCSAVTMEAWADYGTLPANCYLFSLGNTDTNGNGEDYVFCAPQAARITLSGVDPGYNGEQTAACNGWSGRTNLHLVAIYDPPAGLLAIYTNGYLAGVNNAITTQLSSVSNVLSYLGRSLYTSDPYAPLNVDEFRIWNGALNPAQIALDAVSGPTQIISDPGPLQAIHLTVPSPLAFNLVYGFTPGGTAPAVANLQASGGPQQAVVTGDFTNLSGVNLLAYGPPAFVSANPNVLTVNASGLVTPVASGTTTITATYGGLSATQTVTAVIATNAFIFDSFGDGFWNLINQGNSNALVATASGASQATPTNGATSQQFEMLYNYQTKTFRIRQQSSWLCLGSLNGGTAPGTAVATVASYSGAASQRWNLLDAGGGYFRIANAATNLMLQSDNGTPAAVTLAVSNASPFQIWKFVYQTNFIKKGSAGYEGSPYNTELTTGWAYNYDDNTSASETAAFDFVPMTYDAPDWENLGAVQGLDSGWLVNPKPAYLMCYNEPDNATQSNTSTNAAAANWPAFQALNLPIVGPGTQNTEDAWENSFYQIVATNKYRVDYSSVHEYVPPNAASLISDLQSVYNAYGRPVWLTEFSPVDWSNTKAWSENDDYNFLAEFMWQAQAQPWLRRFAIFPFSNSNTNSPWVDNGFTGSVFLSNGSTLSPYGELYATWDADLSLHPQIPYILHNLATSFRLAGTNTIAKPQAATIYTRNAATEWALLAAADGNDYVISLNDGRRLSDTNGTLGLAPVGTVGPAVEWTFSGPNSSGYYYIGNPAGGHNLNGSGTAPAITFGLVSSSTQTTATEWRFVKPYQPVTINTNNAAPSIVTITAGSGSVSLGWTGGGGATYFNVYRSGVSGGPYSRLAAALSQNSFQDSSVSNGTSYYYVVTAMNILGVESAYSAEVTAAPTSLTPTNITFGITGGNSLQLVWPGDHTGWTLQVQTNDLNTGLGTNWQNVAGSTGTNQVWAPLTPTSDATFYRLMHP